MYNSEKFTPIAIINKVGFLHAIIRADEFLKSNFIDWILDGYTIRLYDDYLASLRPNSEKYINAEAIYNNYIYKRRHKIPPL